MVRPLTHTHAYRSRLSWRGSTAAGYDAYDRRHHVVVPPADGELVLSSDPAFNGDGQLANPEQLLLAAVSSCQLLMFLAIAARSRVDVLSYEDEAHAVMPEDEKPMRITSITLRPRIAVAAGVNLDRVRRMVQRAHEGCFIANTLNAEIMIEPVLEHAAAASPTPDEGS
ncbi:MAG: OsmC family protein [Solirubrobacterales bacterium]|nr:OsmC family protein [Solirubrobacterales bacterium]